MRLLLAATILLGWAVPAVRAEIPLTYVGRPEIHRVAGAVSQVTLVQPIDGDRAPRVYRSNARQACECCAECRIDTESFLQEFLRPAPSRPLFQSDDLFPLDRFQDPAPPHGNEVVFISGGVEYRR